MECRVPMDDRLSYMSSSNKLRTPGEAAEPKQFRREPTKNQADPGSGGYRCESMASHCRWIVSEYAGRTTNRQHSGFTALTSQHRPISPPHQGMTDEP